MDSEDNPQRAETFLDELEQRLAALDHWAERYPVAFQSSEGPVHRLVHRGYRVLYRIHLDHVEVLHVHHGSRDAPRFT